MPQGTPPAVLLPALPYEFEFVSGIEDITVPLRGAYPESINKEGTFDICPKEGVVLFGVLNEILFSYRSYPALKSDELFAILGLELDDDQISVVGRVIRMKEGS